MKTNYCYLDEEVQIPTTLYHHPAWVSWKETQGWYCIGELDGNPILCRDIDTLNSMAYIVGTSEMDDMNDDYGGRLEELSLRALQFLPDNCAFLRWDLMASPLQDLQGEYIEKRLLELRMNASTKRRCLRKASTESICLDTIVIDLRGGWPIVFSRMDHRVRYSEQLARRRGTLVTKVGEVGLSDFYALYRKTSLLHGLPLPSESCYRELFISARENGLVIDLYLASAFEKLVASAIIARNNCEAWYLFAASDPTLRHAAGPTAILCQALRDCGEVGVEYFDLLGVAPVGMRNHPMSGLSLFKSGFGGIRKSRSGAWDFVINSDVYADYAQVDAIRFR